MASYASSQQYNENIPAWKLPLNKPYTSSVVRDRIRGDDERSSGTATSGFSSMSGGSSGLSHFDYGEDASASGDDMQTQSQTVIQILLPCLICNRRFSPEALERHSSICTKVNIKPKFSPTRGTFNSASMRIKHTPLELFVPTVDSPVEPEETFCRNSRGRNSVGGIGSGTKARSVSRSTTPLRKLGPESTRVTPSRDQYYDDSNSEESYSPSTHAPIQRQNSSCAGSVRGDDSLPSYARPLTNTEPCQFCGRQFVPKAFDRHVKFCEQVYIRKQYEIQPTPKEKEEAMARQEIRTKYKPMKGSSSFSSLRSMSPFRFFGGFGRKDSNGGFKKSNESLVSLTAASCYGDYRHASPAPSQQGHPPLPSKIPHRQAPFLRSRSFTAPQSSPPVKPLRNPSSINRHLLPIQQLGNSTGPNSNNNSTENLFKKSYAHVPSSGYGQDSGFSRGSRIRASLGKNFFRSKRVEPEGTENTMNGMGYQHQNGNGYTGSNGYSWNRREPEDYGSSRKMEIEPEIKRNNTPLFDPTYDPYERAARQLEELLKTQPMKISTNKNSSRKIGLDRMMQSISSPLPDPEPDRPEPPKHSNDYMNNANSSLYSDKGRNGGYFNNNSLSSSWSSGKKNPAPEPPPRKFYNANNNSYSRASEERDSEFEALERFVNAGSEPKPSNEKKESAAQVALEKLQKRNSGRDNTESPLERLRRSFSRENSRSLFNYGNKKKEEEEPAPMDISPPPSSPLSSVSSMSIKVNGEPLNNNNSGTGVTGYAKFCHDCGCPYPTSLSRFCPECGERRVINV